MKESNEPAIDKSKDQEKQKIKSWWIVLATVVFPAIISLATFINGCIDSRNKLDLQKNGQLHEIRYKYLDMALRPSHGTFEQERILKFLVKIGDDSTLSGWAKEQLLEVESVNQEKIRIISLKDSAESHALRVKIDSLGRALTKKILAAGYSSDNEMVVFDAGLGPESLNCKDGTIKSKLPDPSYKKACLETERARSKIWRIWKHQDKWTWITRTEPLVSDMKFEDLPSYDENKSGIECECARAKTQ